jgi:hypothetical protein
MNFKYNCFIPIILNQKKNYAERNCRALGFCLEYEVSQLHHSPMAAQPENTSFISHTRTEQVASVFRIRIGSGFNQVSGSRRAKMTHKIRENLRNFMFRSAGCSLFRAEGFSCSYDVLHDIFYQKNIKLFVQL